MFDFSSILPLKKLMTSFMDRPQACMFFDDLVTTTNIRKPFTAIHWSNERRRARKSGAGSFTYLLSDLIFFSYLVNIFWVKPFLFALSKIYNVANQIRHLYYSSGSFDDLLVFHWPKERLLNFKFFQVSPSPSIKFRILLKFLRFSVRIKSKW